MDIVGGTYREMCELPYWDARYGSGGRAAAAVSNLTGVRLHTYSPRTDLDFAEWKSRGIEICAFPSISDVVFSYFHPLSKPHVEPPIGSIPYNPPIVVEAEIVLRFGMLEGDAVVHAQRAVFDPQTSASPVRFSDNGSRADTLALVLNESELFALSREDNVEAAVEVLMDDNTEAIVVKRGAFGATVFEPNGRAQHVPAFRSQRVFKIGSGDVFSAAFTYFWAVLRRSPAVAAEMASMKVAEYCQTATLPLAHGDPIGLQPVGGSMTGPIMLLGRAKSLARRYVLEEARFRLRELGATVVCPVLDSNMTDADTAVAALLIDDGMSRSSLVQLSKRVGGQYPIVLLDDSEDDNNGAVHSELAFEFVTRDFTTALYNAIWAGATRKNK